jgi:hypothetical protein
VRFDDRLKTVLDSPHVDARDRAVRWRQLVELVARDGGTAPAELLDEAIAEIRNDAPAVDEQVRVATARAIASLPLPIKLISAFAADGVSVSAPILASARLTAFEWGEVLAQAGSECRRFIQALRSESTDRSAPQPAPKEPEVQHEPIPSISEVVARIERLRQSRELASEPPPPELPEPIEAGGNAPVAGLFRWECDENGDIAWVDGAPRGALIGRSIAAGDGDGTADRQIQRAFAAKIPFHDARLNLEEGSPVEGSWMISGSPAFDPATGRFFGYRGVAERTGTEVEASAVAQSAASDPDSLRDLAHEIRTPLNAIIGFADIISGQYLGPAHHPYRERAAEISLQARLLLTAIEDLDFAAKLHSRPAQGEATVHLGTVVERAMPLLCEAAEARGITLEASRSARDLTARIEPELAERLVSRVCTAVIERGAAGERLRLSVDNGGAECRVSISRPKAIQRLSEAELFGSDQMQPDTFALRLARGLARLAGAQLRISDSDIALVFPAAPLGGEHVDVYS